MIKELIALLDGRETGRVIRDNRGKLSFIYDEQWRNADGAYPLSLSMPITLSEALRKAALTEQSVTRKDWQLIMSLPERAVLEVLDEVPQRETFHQVDMLVDGLGNLSPRRLQSLLLGCCSVKVKRLFFWFAERHKHSWLKELDRKAVDLGKGKRMIVRGGKLDTKFNITIPGNLDAGV